MKVECESVLTGSLANNPRAKFTASTETENTKSKHVIFYLYQFSAMSNQEIVFSFMHAYHTYTYAYVVDLIILSITLLLPAPRKLCVVFSHSKIFFVNCAISLRAHSL